MPAIYKEAKVIDNWALAGDISLLRVPFSGEVKAGQFFMLRAWGESPILPRPISVFDYESGILSFLILNRGVGTAYLCGLKRGMEIELSGPFGNGFDIDAARGKKVALVGGGIGIAPLLLLAKSLPQQSDLICGFREETYGLTLFESHVKKVMIATDSGAIGHRGFCTELLRPEEYDIVYCCGPEVMMERVARMCMDTNTTCYISKEAKMACGVGACLGCTCKTKSGAKRICKDGPVFLGEEVYA